MKFRMLLFVSSFLLLLSACGDSETSGEEFVDYPTQSIDMLVAFDPGGSTDVAARAVASIVSEKWGETINVVNQSGGSGSVGTVEAIQSEPDGYTMLMHVTSSGMLNPAVQTDIPYEWDDVTFVARVNTSPLVVIVDSDSDWDTLSDLVEEIENNPGNISYGTSGPGGPSTFATVQIMEQAGIDPNQLNQVVLGGGADTVTGVAGGNIDFAVQNLSEVIELINGGELRGLAISNDERVKVLPDVPTAEEAGFEDFTFQGWNGVVAPKGIPEEVIDRWNEVIKEALNDEEFVNELASLGLVADYLGAKEFTEYVRENYEFALQVVEDLQLKQE